MTQPSESVWKLWREPKGPLVPYIEPFARRLAEQGFCRRYLGQQIRMAARFSRWLLVNRVAAEAVTDDHVRQFLHGSAGKRAINRGTVATVRRFMDFLRQLGVIPTRVEFTERTQIQQVVDAFSGYLLHDQALSNKTLIQYCPFIERFLSNRFGSGPVELATLRAVDVIGFIQRQAARLSSVRAKVATIALRSFLRYARYRGEIHLNLVVAVPAVPNWSMTGIPRAIAAEHVRAVLAHCRRDTPIGCRDYAILMLLARLGLRAGEIVSLTLDSIDWETGRIAVTGKGAHAAWLPLPAEVGEAIVQYLQVRPACNDRALLLRVTAPIRSLGSQMTIGTIVDAALTRAGIDTPRRGAHQFRHALAVDMLRQGATLSEIGSVLRHRHAKTTGIYAKVDIATLRSLSLPWPEV